MGIVGSVVIARWSYGLLRETSAVLLDGSIAVETSAKLRAALEEGTTDVVADLHVWEVAPGRVAVVASVVSDEPKQPEHYQMLLESAAEVAHVTVEVVRCPDHVEHAA